MMRRTWRRAAIPAVGVTTALLAGALVTSRSAQAFDINDWVIDHNRVTVNDKNESSDDEFYLAVISFRSTPGQAGSTSATYNGHLQEIELPNVHSNRPIPPGMGRSVFPNVTRVNAIAIGNGRLPELLGTITIAFESDATPFSTMDGYMRRVRDAARTEFADVIEPMDAASLVDVKSLGDQLRAAAANIKKAGNPSFLEKVGTWIGSVGDPDDKINSKFEMFAAVDDSAGDPTAFPPDPQELLHGLDINGQLQAAVGDDGMSGTLVDRDYALSYGGDKSNYTVDVAVHPG
jgi:hypothetical protein